MLPNSSRGGLAGRSSFLTIALAVALTASAADGDPDSTWAGGGRITFSGDPAPGNTNPTSIKQIVREASGNFLVGGHDTGTFPGWFLHELQPDGTPVATFGANNGSGSASGCSLSGALCGAYLRAIGMQADGRIVVLDGANNVARTASGAHALDTAGVTGGTGVVSLNAYTFNNVGGYIDSAHGLALTPGGDWMVSANGYAGALSTNSDFVTERLAANLALDTTFDDVTVGPATYAGGQDIAFDLADSTFDDARNVIAEPDGHILLVGYADGGPTLAFARMNSDGSPDGAYGSPGGKATLAWAFGQFNTAGVFGLGRLDSAGRLLLGLSGTQTGHTESGIVVTRMLPGGTFDLNFGISYQLPPGCDSAFGYGVAEDSAGRVLVAGVCYTSSFTKTEYVVARFHGDDGSLDTTFGNAGFAIGAFDATSTHDQAWAMVMDAGGRPIIAGDSQPSAASSQQSAMARLEYDLVFTSSFEATPRGRLPAP